MSGFKTLSCEFADTRKALRAGSYPFEDVSREQANKFSGVYPYPHNVVRTRAGDYVNASWITKELIGCQYPTTDYYARWWTALLEAGTTTILMLCQVQEDTILPLYFPTYRNSHIEFKDKDGRCVFITVHSCRWYMKHHVTIRQLHVVIDGNELQTHSVTHLQYAAWEDHKAPPSVETFMWLQNFMKTAPGVRAVHCRAGIGRTGVFLALYMRQTDESAYSVVRRLRKLRPLTVHNRSQYDFVASMIHENYSSSRRSTLLVVDFCGYSAVIPVSIQKGKTTTTHDASWTLDVNGHMIVYISRAMAVSKMLVLLRLQLFSTGRYIEVDKLRRKEWTSIFSCVDL